MGIAALTTGLFSLASAGVAAYSSSKQAAANAAAASDINEATMRFNATQAAEARNWQAVQAETDRAYNASMTAQSQQYNAEQAEIAREFSSQEAAVNRYWEERMASTAHQREVGDLKLAGLNPILSAHSAGAAVPTSAIASAPSGSSSPALHNTPGSVAASVSGLSVPQRKAIMGEFVSSAREALRLSLDYEKARIADKEADASHKQADASLKNAETNAKAQAAQESKIKAEIERINNDISIALEDLDIRKQLKDASVEEKHAIIEKFMSDIDVNREMAAKIGIEKEELERRIRYGTFLSSYLPLEAREIVGNHMIDFVRENKGAIDFFMDNMNGKYELSSDAKAKELTNKVLDWCIEKGYISDKLGKRGK